MFDTANIPPLPSATDLHRLGSTTPSDSRPSLSIPALLQPFLDLATPPFIRHFLSTSTPLHVPHLSRPLPPTSFACHITITRAPAPFTSLTPHRTHAQYLFVPLSSHGSITLGVGVLHSIGTALPSDRNTFSLPFDMRFVHDAETRTLVALLDAPKSDNILLHLSRTAANLPTYTATASFPREKLQALLHPDAPPPTARAVSAALVAFSHTSQRRTCPLCPSPSCHCNVPEPPAPPLPAKNDLRLVRHSFARDAGTHLGVTSKLVFRNGLPAAKLALGAYSAFSHSYAPQNVAHFVGWSLQRYATETTQDPLHSLLALAPPEGAESQPPSATVSEVHCTDDTLTSQQHACAIDPLLQGVDASTLVDVGAASAQRAVAGVAPLALQLQGIDTSTLVDVRAANPGMAVAGSMPVAPQPILPAPSSLSVETSLQSVETSTADRREVRSVGTCAEATAGVAQSCVTSSSSEPSRGEAVAERKGDGETAEEDVRNVMRKMRAEERKIRNRESAQRSNLRKKYRRQEIRAELGVLMAKMESLRGREMRLRGENLRLRKMIKEEDAETVGRTR
ncbi:unnamed protein product [Chondrus crispus]|uniref:BZIP domain-containing protein n=1 Tax=Chondrus crispus TaxID=2769 RepID=R7QJL1_CHOCR|nr:unnamed protein product [Chondrus crispus]CDF37928.1 unnamed protein product [Chondrus crispus]|eukprot:XP_005717799.1 unnamed protein product [Chondrus crispus]